MVDGLLYNEVVASTLHSTDTHGFTEVNFAVTYLDLFLNKKSIVFQAVFGVEKSSCS